MNKLHNQQLAREINYKLRQQKFKENFPNKYKQNQERLKKATAKRKAEKLLPKYETPKLCIKCGSSNKHKDYPMCYYCFCKWDKDNNYLREHIPLTGECMLLSDSDDE